MGRAWCRLGFGLVQEKGKDDPERRKSLNGNRHAESRGVYLGNGGQWELAGESHGK